MVKRTLSNVGQPFLTADGSPIGGMTITFSLIGVASGKPETALDIITGEHIFPSTITVTTAKTEAAGISPGEFSIDLWPTDRSDHLVAYSCNLSGLGLVRKISRTLPQGNDPLSWYEFISSVHLGDTSAVTDSTGDPLTDSTGSVITDSTGI